MRVDALESVPSTQEYSIAKYKNTEETIMVTTQRQTKGIGRDGNTWISNSDSIAFTLCITYKCLIESVSLKVSYLVKEVLEEVTGTSLIVKWPNDIYASTEKGYKKVCGILINTFTISKNSYRYFIGIGINLSGTLPYTTLEHSSGYNSIPNAIKTKSILSLCYHKLTTIQSIEPNNRWNECFPFNYVYLNEQRYFITRIGDTLGLLPYNEQIAMDLLTNNSSTILSHYTSTIELSSEEYSYNRDTNTIYRKESIHSSEVLS
ncbi:BirA family transcriptional regulator, biotin operon repressor / biotin---[acetyl-CoA-carboxylase] ligase [Nematocida sp. AWRm80]|nr:BirA family transcriptional regulator, biotin operon repressor / biotin---[acetyl-CoA-carboxylase] ligase [Nematocida sp. AWRm80]